MGRDCRICEWAGTVGFVNGQGLYVIRMKDSS